MRCSAIWMPRSKVPPLRGPRLVEREQPIEVDVGHVAAIGAARERRDDPPRARILVGACSRGWQMKICRRLGVSPGPVGLNGPVSVKVSRCGWPDGVERVGGAADERLQPQRVRRVVRSMNAAPMIVCGPALSGSRNAAALVDVVAGLRHVLEVGLEVVVAADAGRCTRSPSTVNSSWCAYSSPRTTPRLVRNS